MPLQSPPQALKIKYMTLDERTPQIVKFASNIKYRKKGILKTS